MGMQGQVAGVQRPLWVVVLTLTVGAVLVAGLLGFLRYEVGALFPLAALLTGAAGGLFGWLLMETFGLQATWRAAFVGAVFAALIFAGQHIADYWLIARTLDVAPTFGAYMEAVTGGEAEFGRLGRSSIITLSGVPVTVLWVLDAVLSVGIGGFIGRRTQIEIEASGDQPASVDD